MLMTDSRTFFNDDKAKGNDAFLLRRARPILSGTVYKDFELSLSRREFAGNAIQIVDAYVNYRFEPQLQLQIGKMKPPVGLEALQKPEQFHIFFNERSMVSDLLPYRDIGAELHGDLFGGVISYAGGLFGGVPGLSTTTTTQHRFRQQQELRWPDFRPTVQEHLAFRPQGTRHWHCRRTYQLDSEMHNQQRQHNRIDAGIHNRRPAKVLFLLQQRRQHRRSHTDYATGILLLGPVWICWVNTSQTTDHVSHFGKTVTSANLENTAWDISGGYVLTGEDATYTTR